MARNRPIKILWYGSETDDEGNPIIPKISPSFEKRLEGLNEGEIYIHNDDNNPSIYIRTNKDRVVAISGGANIEELSKYFLRKDKEDTANELITFLKGLLIGKNGSELLCLRTVCHRLLSIICMSRSKPFLMNLRSRRKRMWVASR